MSRVEEDREAQRIEHAVQERKLQERKQADKASFGKLVASRQVATKNNTKRDGQAKDKNSNAERMLSARSGIRSNLRQATEFKEGDGRRMNNRSTSESHDRDQVARRDDAQHREEQRLEQGLGKGNAPISRDDEKKGNQGGDSGSSKGDSNRDNKNLAAQVAASPAMQQLNAAASQKSAGGTSVATQRIIDEIVKNVRKGMSAKGMGTIQIDLKDNVLAGSSLLITSGKDGVSIRVTTFDKQVERLVGSGGSLKELQKAFSDKGLVLKELTINLLK